MRLKKQKQHRKAVRFYKACFGFRKPFKVLCDGTFIHHLLLHGLTPADDALAHLLGARALLFTTRCIIGELRSLGKSHLETLEAAEQLVLARCDHEKRVRAMSCIESVIGKTNSEHFFVATQDVDIRKKFREVPGVPVVYGRKNALFVEQPSARQLEFAKAAEEKRLHFSEIEYQKLQNRAFKDGNDSDNGDTEATEHTEINDTSTRALGVSEKSKVKRQRAKGPNPLSCKKKKKDNSSVAQNQNDTANDTTTKRKRIRKRKRSKMETTTPVESAS